MHPEGRRGHPHAGLQAACRVPRGGGWRCSAILRLLVFGAVMAAALSPTLARAGVLCLPSPLGEVVLLDSPGCAERLTAQQWQADWSQALVAGEAPACWRRDGPLIIVTQGGSELALAEFAAAELDACPAAAGSYRRQQQEADRESCADLDLPDAVAVVACRRTMSVVRSLPEDDPRLLEAMEMLALRLGDRSRAEAEALLERAVSLRRRHFPDDDRGMFGAMISIARLRLRGPEDQVALARYREVLEFGRRRVGADHGDVIIWTLSLGKRLLDWGQLAEGEALMQSCLDSVERNRAGLGRYALGLTTGCARILGEAYARAGRADDAERLAERARRTRSAALLGDPGGLPEPLPPALRNTFLVMRVEHPAGTVALMDIPCRPPEPERRRFMGILDPREATAGDAVEVVCWEYSGKGITVQRPGSAESIELPESAVRYELQELPEDWLPGVEEERGPPV